MTNNQIAQTVSKRFNVPIEYVTDRQDHDKRYSIDYSKIKTELSWRPVITFDDALEKTMIFYIEDTWN